MDTSLRTRVRVVDRGYANDFPAGRCANAQYKFWILDFLGYERKNVTLIHQLQAMWCRLPSPVKDI
ncbi:MAG: hypothetical protein ACIWVG_09955, partial [Gloeotrichia echinulata HAB0833]